MRKTELVDRIRMVLREFSTLSETDAMRYDGDRVKGGGSKSAPPPGTRFGRRDLRDLSYAEFWQDRFRQVRGDEHKLTFFLYLAELDLARAKKRQPGRDPHESVDAREERCIQQYRGLDPIEAAVAEDCTEQWIRRVRLKHGVDPDTGYHRTHP